MSCSLHSHSGGVTIPPDTLHLTLMSSVLLLTTSSSVSLTQDVEDLADPGSFETISQPGNSIPELFEPIRDWKDWKREILNCSVKLPISQDVSLFGCPDCGDQDQDDVLRTVLQWLPLSVLILSISPQSDSAQKNNKCKWSRHSPCNISNGVSSVLKKTVEVRFKIHNIVIMWLWSV